MVPGTGLVFSVLLLSCCSGVLGHSETQRCVYYIHRPSSSSRSEVMVNGSSVVICPGDKDKQPHCFASWKNISGEVQVVQQGCWLGDHSCYDSSDCVEKKDAPEVFFCCCDGRLCNHKFSYRPQNSQLPQLPTSGPAQPRVEPLVFTLVSFMVISCAILLSFWVYRRHQRAYPPVRLPTQDSYSISPSPILAQRPLQLLEVKARGRFGCVWKAQLFSEHVAVKIFSIQEQQSWQNEYGIYSLSGMRHSNMLQFIGAEKRGNSMEPELWLITAYHEKGSVCDYLKANILSWSELCRVAHTMSQGVAYLHEDIQGQKPAIAHRDIKSKNILLKSDLTACIADFGLALRFEAGKSPGDAHGHVGTRRYMAPEVLEGAINFQRDAFLRIDMYAVGLVLWELASRCKAADGPVEEYMLPFEEELGQHPSLEDMQEVVVHNKLRPVLRECWKKHAGLLLFCETIEECWDHEAEARVSAGCVEERVLQMQQQMSITSEDLGTMVTMVTNVPKELSL